MSYSIEINKNFGVFFTRKSLKTCNITRNHPYTFLPNSFYACLICLFLSCILSFCNFFFHIDFVTLFILQTKSTIWLVDSPLLFHMLQQQQFQNMLMNRVAFLAILEQINKTHENSLSTSLYTAPSRCSYTLSLFHIFISQHILLFILTLLKQLCANFISQAFHVSLSFLSQQIPFQIQFIFCCHFQIIIEQITVKKQ